MTTRRRGLVRSLRDKVRERALLKEIKRIRQLLELKEDVYSDLFVLKRAREELEELARDDEREELEEEQLMDDEE